MQTIIVEPTQVFATDSAKQQIGNWLGGEVVSNEIGQPGFNCSGYTNVLTSDGIVHGQVKQSGAFSFVRIYESGHVSLSKSRFTPCTKIWAGIHMSGVFGHKHGSWLRFPSRSGYANSKIFIQEVPFYQPEIALAIFERAIAGLDIATGLVNVTSGYRTFGPPTSDYREGNATVQFEVVNTNTTYNTTTNEPNPPSMGRFAKRQGEQLHYGKVLKPVKL